MENLGMSFVPPPYPYERLEGIIRAASLHEGGAIECSIGTPIDEPPAFILAALAQATGAKGYPPSAGTVEFRDAAAMWLHSYFGVDIDANQVGATIGTKEFVASLAHYLHLRDNSKDTVLYPAISYPTYAMSAQLAGLRAVPVAMVDGRLDLGSIDERDAARALVLWTNGPSNPTGALEDLESVVAWGRARSILVASDECYAPFTWHEAPRTILSSGTKGVLSLHSISKRSNLAGVRAGFFAGDAEIVTYLKAVRQHAGMMVPAPVQHAVAVAYGDEAHVLEQRARYYERLSILSEALTSVGIDAPMPDGGFYLWVSREGTSCWDLSMELAERTGLVSSPGDLYGEAGAPYVRIAVVQPTERLQVVAERLVH
jgi:succinyldiaminopimelate transaminase